MLYDLFISHASEDKATFVRALAKRLVEEHLTVWYDEYELRLGDSLRRSIDHGLSESRFGVIILSEAFFAKNWPQYELDGLVTRENLQGEQALLPVWHEVDAARVAKYSLSLAGRVAVSTREGLDDVVAAIVRAIRPRPSPLVLAREELEAWGVLPPTVTDEYWLDVVEASNRASAFGPMIEDASIWGRWSFPLPPLDGTTEARGLRLAWTALQLRWIEDADNAPVDLISEPHIVHRFLARHPGLIDACREFPRLLAEYAPQLTIPGNGGEFESLFEAEYQNSKARYNAQSGGYTCDEEWLLRDAEFGGYGDYGIMHYWFSGGMFGPPVRLHEHADYVFWLFSVRSSWLPVQIREAMRRGASEQPELWLWHASASDSSGVPSQGSLSKEYFRVLHTRARDIKWTARVWEDVVQRSGKAAVALDLPESGEKLAASFREYEVLRRGLLAHRSMKTRRAARPTEDRQK